MRQRLKAADALPHGWSLVEQQEQLQLLGEAVENKVVLGMQDLTTDSIVNVMLAVLEARYGRALYRQRDTFYRPKNVRPRAINWSTLIV